jgi:hypothetical protein
MTRQHEIDREKRIRSSVFERWGDPDTTGRLGLHPFGEAVTCHRTFDGVTIPQAGTVGWYFDRSVGGR